MSARLHLNRFGTAVRAGYRVTYFHPHCGKESGIVARIWFDRWQMPGNSGVWRVKLTTGATCCLDDIASAGPVVLKWQDVNPRGYAKPTALLVDFGHKDGAPRWCVVGAAYGYLHTTSGDIRTWRSRSGAQRVARAYV